MVFAKIVKKKIRKKKMTELAELYMTIGSAGMICILFGYLLMNLVSSQKDQTDDLESIRADLSKMSAELSNTQNISIKLIDSVNSFKENMNDKIDRKFDRQDENLEDLSKSIAYLQGKNNGGSK
tara:strand:+ start:97 stop:468 length:372 start_codon:yes stop_codon:yes gene_type:complete